MARDYYVLVAREHAHDVWRIEFGSYDLADVEAERDDYRDRDWRSANLGILRCGDSEAEILAEVAKLNERSR